VTKAERTNRTAQAIPSKQPPEEFAAASVTLSPGSVELTRPVQPPNACSYLDTLTTSDKAAVHAAGWDRDADPMGENVSLSAN